MNGHILPVLLLVSSGILFSQELTVHPKIPDDVTQAVEQYCKMDAEGRWIGLNSPVEDNTYFSEEGSNISEGEIIVIKRYTAGVPVGTSGPDGVGYQAGVDYLEWGGIDSFLHFEWGAGHENVPWASRQWKHVMSASTRLVSPRTTHEPAKSQNGPSPGEL